MVNGYVYPESHADFSNGHDDITVHSRHEMTTFEVEEESQEYPTRIPKDLCLNRYSDASLP